MVYSGYGGGEYVVTRYDDRRTIGEPRPRRDVRQLLNPYFSRLFLQRYVLPCRPCRAVAQKHP